MSKHAVPDRIPSQPCEPPVLTDASLRSGFSGDVSWVYAHRLSREALRDLLWPEPLAARSNTTH